MLWKAFLLGAIVALRVQAGDVFGSFDESPFNSWKDLYAAESRTHEKDVEPITERDREPLSPDYKEPNSEKEKPVLNPKPQKPSYDPSLIPGGIIEVPANGFPSLFGDPFQIPNINDRPGSGLFEFGSDDFGFPSLNSHRPGSLFGGFFSSTGENRPWWKGPNVCIEREESTDDENEEEGRDLGKNDTETEEVPNFFSTSISLSNCQQTPTKYECVTKINNHGVVKTFTVRYKCCYGYQRSEGSAGCDKQVELKTLLETLTDLNAKEFRKLVDDNGLGDRFKNENLTVFAPLDQAMNDFNEKMNQFNDLGPMSLRKRDLKNIMSSEEFVRNHVTEGFVDLSEIINEEVIYNENQNNSIRINNYPTQNYERMVTANCKRVAKANNLASNGIVHLVDGVITPIRDSVQDIIRNDRRLTSLKQVLENTDLFKKFKNDGHYTVFAPTNDAFEKLDVATREKLLRGEACAKSIISHHVTAHTVCSIAIIGNSTTHNVDGEVLNMERTVDDQLIFENKAKIVETDIMGTNGVIHLIDTITIPESALFINDALKKEKLTKFQELIEKAGLTEEINDLKNATVFAPSDEAFEKEKAKKLLEEIGDDREKLKALVRYHTVQGKVQSCDMNNNAVLESLDNGQPLRLNLYSTLPIFNNIVNKATVNCARITGFDEKTCGSVIHEVNKILVPSKQNILEVVRSDPKYSKIQKIIEGTEIEDILGQENRTITFLAPTDETLAALDEEQLKTLEDKEKSVEILKTHIITEILCCTGVGPQTWGFNSMVPTLSHQNLQIGRTGNHQIRIGRGVVTSCDNLATNGVVHSINKVFFPQRQVPANVGGFFLFDF